MFELHYKKGSVWKQWVDYDSKRQIYVNPKFNSMGEVVVHIAKYGEEDYMYRVVGSTGLTQIVSYKVWHAVRENMLEHI